MRINKLIGGFALTALLGVGMASCSNELDSYDSKTVGDMLRKAPRATAYAGNEKWDPFTPGFATRATNTEANRWAEMWDCPPREANDLTPEELEELKELLSFGHEVWNETVFPFENYWIQQIYKGESVYTPTDKFGDDCNEHILGSGQMDHMMALNDYGSEQVPNFNYGDNTNNPGNCQECGKSLAGTALMLDMAGESERSPYTQFSYHESYGSYEYYNYYIVKYKGYYYLGFDYEMHKDANNPGEVKDVNRDWNFTDWIVRIVPAYPKGETPETPDPDPETPENPDPETPDGPDVNIPDVVDPGFPVDPETPEVPEIQIPDDIDSGFTVTPEQPVIREEVEINLALDEKEDGDIRSSHLSIHVRTATDVEVFIPVAPQYYCEADDMAIVMQHEPNHMGHGGPTEFTWTLKDSNLTVSLYVRYEEDGIRIWTDGITQEVIDWCYEKCQDGITFEVWNYFNDPDGNPLISNEELRQYLDQATVRFLDKVPDYYINSFADPNGKYGDDNPNGDDFHVRPVNPSEFQESFEGPHYNNSEVNDIYAKSNVPTNPQPPVY